MKVWWCTEHQRAGLVETFCCSFGQMVEMELHPVGTRVVTAGALVIEKVDGEWPGEVIAGMYGTYAAGKDLGWEMTPILIEMLDALDALERAEP